MAEASRNPLPSGFDEDFVNAVEDDFQCLICQLPQKEPVQTRCGHRFCKGCLEEHLRRCGFVISVLTLERLSMTLRQTGNFRRPSSAACTAE